MVCRTKCPNASDIDEKQKFVFELEFHIPYLALRRGRKMTDKRNFRGEPLRQAIPLPLPRQLDETADFFYEAQISVLVAGVDEWVWTSYCFVDAFYGSEPERLEYLDPPHPSEPASGGSKSLNLPKWSPREFFLCVLDYRIMQAVREFKALIDAFVERMNTYVSPASSDQMFEMLIFSAGIEVFV